MQELADTELLRQYAEESSETAFEALVSRHVNLVFSAAFRKTGNFHAAEEITQAVFIILAKKAGFPAQGNMSAGWLVPGGAIHGSQFSARRNPARAPRTGGIYAISFPNEPEIWPQIVPLLEDAMGRLNEKDRNAIVLRFFEGKSFQEIGAASAPVKMPPKNVSPMPWKNCGNSFAKQGVLSTAAAIGSVISANSIQAAPAGLAKTISAGAIAKGAAGSASTLTLVHGALKIMAWTKTKITIAAAAAALLVAGGSIVTINAVNSARTAAALHRMQGDWEGILNAGPEKLRVVFRIIETNGTYQAVFDSVDQGVTGLPVPKMSAGGNSFSAQIPAISASYVAALNPDGSELSGTWKQVNSSFPLNLKRTETPDTVTVMTEDQYAPRADSDLQGAWMGELKVQGVSLRLGLRISEPSPGTFQAVLDSPDQGAKNIPITSLTYNKPAIRLMMDSINGVFEGNLQSQDEFSGTWTQMRKKYPLTFHRAQINEQTVADGGKNYGTGNRYQIPGHWKGALSVNGTQLHIVFNIAQMDDHVFRDVDSPDQGAVGIPATEATISYPNVRLTWKAIGGVFDGKLEDGKLSGSWRQGRAFPLQLERDKSQL